MPHKINPIHFENAEGNLGVANALLVHFSNKLPVSRWQRDLSDSTVCRNFGSSFAYTVLGWKSAAEGLDRIDVRKECIESDLDSNWEIVSEAIQTVLRRVGIPDGFSKLKELTRGQHVTRVDIHAFIDGLDIDDQTKDELKSISPRTYLGNAASQAQRIAEE